jgi:hypothetical protein
LYSTVTLQSRDRWPSASKAHGKEGLRLRTPQALARCPHWKTVSLDNRLHLSELMGPMSHLWDFPVTSWDGKGSNKVRCGEMFEESKVSFVRKNRELEQNEGK